MQINVRDRNTHPTIGSWVWGSQGIPYRVTRRFRHEGRFFIGIATPQGDRTLPLSEVIGWCPELSTGTQIISDTGWLATIVGFDPSDGMYRVEGECIVGWLFPDQFSVTNSEEGIAA